MGQKVNISKFYSLSVEHCMYIYHVSNAGGKQTQLVLSTVRIYIMYPMQVENRLNVKGTNAFFLERAYTYVLSAHCN